jgi:hypothetical protein
MTIISDKYKFVFLKTAKTAGTSVEMALETICAPDDICAPVTKKKTSRPGEESYHARNYKGCFIPRFTRPENFESRFFKELRELFILHRKYKSHMPATDVCWRLGRKKWDAYFKFTVERNPWDKAVSAYYFAQRHPENRIPFEEWLPKNLTQSNMSFYTMGGKVAVDHILRFENLQADLDATLTKLGVENLPKLPYSKSTFRPKKANYWDVHTEFTRDYVARVCQPEIEYFGYTF